MPLSFSHNLEWVLVYNLFSRLSIHIYINNTFLRLTEEFTGKDLLSEKFSNSFASSSSITADCSLKLGWSSSIMSREPFSISTGEAVPSWNTAGPSTEEITLDNYWILNTIMLSIYPNMVELLSPDLLITFIF